MKSIDTQLFYLQKIHKQPANVQKGGKISFSFAFVLSFYLVSFMLFYSSTQKRKMPSFVVPMKKVDCSQTANISQESSDLRSDPSIILESRFDNIRKIDEDKKESPFKTCLQTCSENGVSIRFQSKDESDDNDINTNCDETDSLMNDASIYNNICTEENTEILPVSNEKQKEYASNVLDVNEEIGGKKDFVDETTIKKINKKDKSVGKKKDKGIKSNKNTLRKSKEQKPKKSKEGSWNSDSNTNHNGETRYITSSQIVPENENVPLSQASNFSSVFTNMILSQAPKNFSHKQKLEWLQERREVGLWVMCNKADCQKWRYLPHIHDPTALPAVWFCNMNPDGRANDCAKKEQKLNILEEEDCIHGQYSAGSLVWARLQGYPWWPAIVDDDPDTEQFYWLDGFSDIPTYYNVTFFDSEKVTRAWVTPKNLKPLTSQGMYKPIKTRSTRTIFEKRIKFAIEQAKQAILMSVMERLKTFSFIGRYDGAINTPRGEKMLKKTKRRMEISSESSTSDSETVTPIVNFRRNNKRNKASIPKKLDSDLSSYTLVSLEDLIALDDEVENNTRNESQSFSSEIPIQPNIIITNSQKNNMEKNIIIDETDSIIANTDKHATEIDSQNIDLDAVVPSTEMDLRNITQEITQFTPY